VLSRLQPLRLPARRPLLLVPLVDWRALIIVWMTCTQSSGVVSFAMARWLYAVRCLPFLRSDRDRADVNGIGLIKEAVAAGHKRVGDSMPQYPSLRRVDP